MKINEKTFCQYQYLKNFDKYKKIKIHNRKNSFINDEKKNMNINSLNRKKKSNY